MSLPFRASRLLGVLAVMHFGVAAFAQVTVFYPRDVVPVYLEPARKWLADSTGDDVYVRIDASVDSEVVCQTTGASGIVGRIGEKRAQLAVAINISGLKSPFGAASIPLLSVDGRNSPGGCQIMRAADINVVPATLLPQIADASADGLSIRTNVYYTLQTSLNLTQATAAVASIASVFATGGAVAPLAAFSAVLAEPALSKAQSTAEEKLKLVLPMDAAWEKKWAEFRTLGVQYLDTAVHETVVPSVPTGTQLTELRKRKNVADPAFTVRLKFSYSKSIFDSLSDTKELPDLSKVSGPNRLNYPYLPGAPTLLQFLMSDGTPNLAQAFAAASSQGDWERECARGNGLLEKAGLNALDRGIALKIFIDMARSSNQWYSSPSSAYSDACFSRVHKDVAPKLRAIYSRPPSEFVEPDAQRLPSLSVAQASLWRSEVELMSSLQRALTMDGNREEQVREISTGDELKVKIGNGTTLWDKEWTAGLDTSNPLVPIVPDIRMLTTQRFLAAGCFMSIKMGGYATARSQFLLLSKQGTIWIVRPSAVDSNFSKLSKIEIEQIYPAMANHIREWIDASSFGNASVCTKVMRPRLDAIADSIIAG